LLAYVFAVVVIVVAAILAFGLAALLHLQGTSYIIFIALVLVVGLIAVITILLMHRAAKKRKQLGQDGDGVDARADLDLLLRDANRKLRNSQQGAKNLQALPLIYVLGETGSAKTTSVVNSGLDPELLAGTASQGGEQVSTQVLNLWFTRLASFLEFGSAVRQSSPLRAHLVNHTRAKAYRSAFGSGAAPRAVVVCLSADLLLETDDEPLMASARATGAQLRDVSRILGVPVPVYVIVTKLDRVSHFADYVRNLSDDEVRQVMGALVSRSEATAGTYVDQASRMLAFHVDELVRQLGDFRLEILDRETDTRKIPGAYEFPREFGKLRKNLNQYLVELCKPSQLNTNPYLRGFFFVGERDRIVERMAPPVAAVERTEPRDPGATIFIDRSLGLGAATSAPAPPKMISSRVQQWTFLPRLLSEVILGDKSAIAPTRQSTPARLFRRILFAALALLFALGTAFVALSYINNARLEHRIAEVVHALPAVGANETSLPGPTDLESLESLRQVIVQLDGYQRDGRPLLYRFGLYQGDKLDTEARRIYFDRFRPMLLNPTQANLVNYMRSLPDAPQATTDLSSYLDAYNPLKTYLITTNHPEKSDSKFLTPIFLKYWIGSRQVDPRQQQLAQKQIDFYGNELLREPPYAIDPEALLVAHTQAYLSKFLAETRVYQNMLNDADRAGAPVDFNKQYPDAIRIVSDGHVVRGAFTKAGFAFMEGALQHPEKYAQGETWVLGNQAGVSLNSSTIGRDLAGHYSADFIKEWREFLQSAHIAGCGTLKETPNVLNTLAGPASPILELLYVVSHNTAVNDPQIKSAFQPAQVLVDPNATGRVIGPGNAAYVTALSNLSGALDLVSQNPAAASDPAAFAPVQQQVVAANGAVMQIAQAFSVDQQNHTERTVTGILQAPIQCVGRFAPSPGAPANGGGAKICSAITPLLAKFPFSSNASASASLQEVDGVFAPDAGVFWVAYNSMLKPFLIPIGSQYGQAPTAPQPLNPRFLNYFNRAAHISNALYPPGQKSASLNFTLRFIPGNGVSSGTLVVDGQRLAGTSTQPFTWGGAQAQRASLVYNGTEVLPYQGTWALFQLVRIAQTTRLSPGVYRLDYPITSQTTVAGHTVNGSGNSAEKVSFELAGPGADLLVGDAFTGLSCALPAVRP
jgi:type VI secretion system protein ImpL